MTRDPRRRAKTVLSISHSILFAAAGLALLAYGAWRSAEGIAQAPAAPQKLDPAAWGKDHVGEPLPDYMESGECLFCHRNEIGGPWAHNRHNTTIREAEPSEPAISALKNDPATKVLADQVQLILGDGRAERFLKRSAAYGKADLLSVVATVGADKKVHLGSTEKAHWDEQTFATGCAGCHATAVDPETHAFVTVSLDCFSCHGDAPAQHAADTKLMALSKARKDSPLVVTSICASCHVRFGTSKASGLPYANNFVAGDNLFKDFQVDLAKAEDPALNPGDRHVMMNVRDVVLSGREEITCLSCHDVHTSSSHKHRNLRVSEICAQCHDLGGRIRGHKEYEVHSERCQY
jgi:predicted CXXCH cytochrome family protein